MCLFPTLIQSKEVFFADSFFPRFSCVSCLRGMELLANLSLLGVFFADNANFGHFQNTLKTIGCDVFHVFFAYETINNIEQ